LEEERQEYRITQKVSKIFLYRFNTVLFQFQNHPLRVVCKKTLMHWSSSWHRKRSHSWTLWTQIPGYASKQS